jgi:hypothetical protein
MTAIRSLRLLLPIGALLLQSIGFATPLLQEPETSRQRL